MGVLTYGAARERIALDDRVLAHLQIVIGTKLRRKESFYLTIDHVDPVERVVLWVDHSVQLHFRYSGSRQPRINRAWIEALAAQANSSGGLRLVDEPPVSLSQAPLTE